MKCEVLHTLMACNDTAQVFKQRSNQGLDLIIKFNRI